MDKEISKKLHQLELLIFGLENLKEHDIVIEAFCDEALEILTTIKLSFENFERKNDA